MLNITFHSQMAGLVTNSSTELFVINKPVEDLEELLLGLVAVHNLVCQTYPTVKPISYSDVLREVPVLFKKNKEIKYSIKEVIDDFNNGEYIGNEEEEPLTYDTVFKKPELYTEEDYDYDKKDLQKYFDYYKNHKNKNLRSQYTSPKELGWGYEKKENIGVTFLYGADDNSVPYWMFDVIEHLGVDVERFHLG